MKPIAGPFVYYHFLLMRRILPGPWPHAVLCRRDIEHSSKNYCTSITGDEVLTVRSGLACHDYYPEALSLVSVTVWWHARVQPCLRSW